MSEWFVSLEGVNKFVLIVWIGVVIMVAFHRDGRS